MQVICESFTFKVKNPEETWFPFVFCFEEIENSDELVEWCFEHFKPVLIQPKKHSRLPEIEYQVFCDLLYNGFLLYIHFRNQEDAAYFKLVWL
jgi:hypothetical protein